MTTPQHYNIILLSYTSIIITQNNLIHQFYKMVSYTLLINNVDTRDPIGSKKCPGWMLGTWLSSFANMFLLPIDIAITFSVDSRGNGS